ncbi:MAG: type II toxin-antitoxin system VapC family toxin [Armatimonadota bacterium]|nr:type II toxin-antitoxin system VapC family toxin [Armatimonadota bacterium]
MKVTAALAGVRWLFLDTAPVIYHVEGNAVYQPATDEIFQTISDGRCEAITSSITLTECLVHPYRRADAALAQRFEDVIIAGANTRYVGVDAVATPAAQLRARYNLTLGDSLQIAAALAAGCDAFLTNDKRLKRITELTVLVLEELET